MFFGIMRGPKSSIHAAVAVLSLLGACAETDDPNPNLDLGTADSGPPVDGGSNGGVDGGLDAGLVDIGPGCVSVCAEGEVCDPDTGECTCGDGPACEDGKACRNGACVDDPAPSCTEGHAYTAGTPAFARVTDDAGLDGVQGTRLAVLDLEGDGYPDLFVRRGGTRADDFSESGQRHSWVLRNRGDGTFEDVTQASGLRARREPDGTLGHPGEVVASADVDNDGDLDVFVGIDDNLGENGGESNELYLNQGDGTFVLADASHPLRRPGTFDMVSGAAFVDHDRDGNVDLYIGRSSAPPTYQGDLLYSNFGQGFWFDVTRDVGLATEPWNLVADIDAGQAHSRAWSVTACDLNDDGDPELLAASYGRAPNHLWQAGRDGDGALSYANRSVASGYAFDGNQEWESNQFARCFCAANRTAAGCAAVPAPAIQCPNPPNWSHDFDRNPFRLGGNSGTTVCADVDNDGHMDLFTTEITHWWAGLGADRSELLVNTGEEDVRFERPGEASTGITRPNEGSWDQGDITAAVFDFDNDGWPDVYVGATDYPDNRGLLYRQTSPGRFESVSIQDGIDHYRSHGIAVADFDRDGDLDVVVGHSRARCGGDDRCQPTQQVQMFENLRAQDGNWLQLELEGGARSNRAAIGARVEVTAGGVTQTQEVGGGHGHYGIQHDLALHFGLGAACEATVSIRWPDNALSVQTFDAVSGVRYRVVQGEAPRVVQRRDL